MFGCSILYSLLLGTSQNAEITSDFANSWLRRMFLHDCLRLISFSKRVFVVLNKYISQLKTLPLQCWNNEEATFLVAKYICSEQQTLAWKKKSNVNNTAEITSDFEIDIINSLITAVRDQSGCKNHQ